MPFKWVLLCPACQKTCVADRKDFNREISCPHCGKEDKIDLGFDIKGEERFKPSFSTTDFTRALKKKFVAMNDEALIEYRDMIDIKKHGHAAMVTMLYVLRELERRNIS